MTMLDLLVIGGGINGVGIARDAAGRGMKVALCEKDDLASHTSSASTKLIHGGLRYLEHYEFRLVRESLKEREVLLRAAPHIIWPMRFVLPYDKGLRPALLLRTGLFLYDHIGGRKMLPKTSKADLDAAPHEDVLQERLTFGYEYSDCWVEDARLVALSAVDAKERGADIMTRTECVALSRKNGHWEAVLKSSTGEEKTITAKAVANAAGPWVDDLLEQVYPGKNKKNLRLVKGSHIVCHKLYEGDHCYIFQNADNRIIFAIPYEGDYTLVGTTDQSFSGDQNVVEISEEETDYLCNAASEYFRKAVTREDIAWTYAGVRPLYDDQKSDNSTVTRDYVFDVDAPEHEGKTAPPILSVFGGKLTTFRKLSEHALEKLSAYIDVKGEAWTREAVLPGGDIPEANFDSYFAKMRQTYGWMDEKTLRRMARYYGTRLPLVLGNAKSTADLGQSFGAGLTEAEIQYLIAQEFVTCADDVLWRRTKLGLHMNDAEKQAVTSWFEAQS